MTIYTEVYPWKVENEVKAGAKVYMLDKSNGTTQLLNYPSYETVLKTLGIKDNRFYFWKVEELDWKKNQATKEEASE